MEPFTTDDVDAMEEEDLRAACIALDYPATGSISSLRGQLLRHLHCEAAEAAEDEPTDTRKARPCRTPSPPLDPGDSDMAAQAPPDLPTPRAGAFGTPKKHARHSIVRRLVAEYEAPGFADENDFAALDARDTLAEDAQLEAAAFNAGADGGPSGAASPPPGSPPRRPPKRGPDQPLGTPVRREAAPRMGPTPVKIRSLPNAPSGSASLPARLAHEAGLAEDLELEDAGPLDEQPAPRAAGSEEVDDRACAAPEVPPTAQPPPSSQGARVGGTAPVQAQDSRSHPAAMHGHGPPPATSDRRAARRGPPAPSPPFAGDGTRPVSPRSLRSQPTGSPPQDPPVGAPRGPLNSMPAAPDCGGPAPGDPGPHFPEDAVMGTASPEPWPMAPQLTDPAKARLEALPLRPTFSRLLRLQHAALCALARTQGLPRRSLETKQDLATRLARFLEDDPTRSLTLPAGLSRRPTEPNATPPPGPPPPSDQGAVPPAAPRPTPPRRQASTATGPAPTSLGLTAVMDQVEGLLASLASMGRDAASGRVDTSRMTDLGAAAERLLPVVRGASAGLAAAAALPPTPSPAAGHSPGSGPRPTWADMARQAPATTPGHHYSQRPPPEAGEGELRSWRLQQQQRTAQHWTRQRTLLVTPNNSEMRRQPILRTDLVRKIEAILHHEGGGDSSCPTRFVELAKRTARGDFLLQILPSAWPTVQGQHQYDLGPWGVWRALETSGMDTGIDMSVVVTDIPVQLSPSEIREDFLACNARRFAGLDHTALGANILRVERLKRRLQRGPRQGELQDSTSVRFVVTQRLGQAMLETRSAILDCSVHDVRPFLPSPTRCGHCGALGHRAAFCRNPARCRTCGARGTHDTLHCPHRDQHSHGDDGPAR